MELKRCLAASGANLGDEPDTPAPRPPRGDAKNRCEELGSSGEEDMETQINTERKLALASSDGFISKARAQGGATSTQIHSPKSTERDREHSEPNMSD